MSTLSYLHSYICPQMDGLCLERWESCHYITSVSAHLGLPPGGWPALSGESVSFAYSYGSVFVFVSAGKSLHVLLHFSCIVSDAVFMCVVSVVDCLACSVSVVESFMCVAGCFLCCFCCRLFRVYCLCRRLFCVYFCCWLFSSGVVHNCFWYQLIGVCCFCCQLFSMLCLFQPVMCFCHSLYFVFVLAVHFTCVVSFAGCFICVASVANCLVCAVANSFTCAVSVATVLLLCCSHCRLFLCVPFLLQALLCVVYVANCCYVCCLCCRWF